MVLNEFFLYAVEIEKYNVSGNVDYLYQSVSPTRLKIEESENTDSKWLKTFDVGIIVHPQDGGSYLPDIPFSECIVNTKDYRQMVENYTEWPYSCIVKLHLFPSLTSKEGECGGTGVMIGPQHVLTAGHNIHQADWMRHIIAIPAYNNKIAPFKTASATQFYIFQEWKNKKNINYDIGIIVLDRPIGLKTGWLGMRSLKDADFLNRKISVTGYPYDRELAKVMYSMTGNIVDIKQQILFYKIDTNQGQSGAPVWGIVDGEYYIFAIHAYGQNKKNNDLGNFGIRITENIIQTFRDNVLLPTWQMVESPNPAITSVNEQEEIAMKCYQNNDYQTAFKWFKFLAPQNKVVFQYHLGLFYKEGKGTDVNVHEAMKWLKKASDQDFLEAHNLLGECIYIEAELIQEKDESKAKDLMKEAVELFRKAADRGLPKAQKNLANCYDKGHGVPKDEKQWQYWMQKATNTPVGGDDLHNNICDSSDLGTCTQVDLRNRRIDEASIDTLVQAFLKMKKLKQVCLGNNKMSKQILAKFIEAINKTTVEKIRVYTNNLSDEHVDALFSKIHLDTLKAIEVSEMYLTPTDVETLKHFLPSMTQITHLSLNNNHLTDKNLQDLADVFQKMLALVRLYLENNQITNSSILTIKDIFKKLSHLQYMYLNGNPIDNRNELKKLAHKIYW